MISYQEQRIVSAMARTTDGEPPEETIGSLVAEVLDSGKRVREKPEGSYRVRTPTNSERINRALAELRPAAFKIHLLMWKWRGAPAKGSLSFFTLYSLAKFCRLTRPTIRTAMRELTSKGWIERLPYSKHHKNTLYRLVPVRQIPRPSEVSQGDD